jgi:muconolactone D-isomerase
MEYLVIGRPLEGIKAKKIMDKAKAGLEYRDGLKSDGKIIYFGNFTGRRGGCAIYDAKDHVELHELLHADPMYKYMKFEVTPLTPAKKTIELIERVHKH